MINISICNRGPEPAAIHMLPTVCFRTPGRGLAEAQRPALQAVAADGRAVIRTHDADRFFTNRWRIIICTARCPPAAIHAERIQQCPLVRNRKHTPNVKDGINDYVVHGKRDSVNPDHIGTKASPNQDLITAGGQSHIRRDPHDPAAGIDVLLGRFRVHRATIRVGQISEKEGDL